jgi:phosphate transport system permease protein
MSHTRHGFVNGQCSTSWVSGPVGTFSLVREKRASASRVATSDRPRVKLATAPSWHRAAEWGLRLLAGGAAIAIVLILVFIAKEAAPLFYDREVRAEVTMAKMWLPQLWPGYDEAGTVWQPVSDIPKYGVWPLVLGTLKVTVVAMIVAVPLGVGAALYVSQYARPKVREVVKPVVELLAGIPSVVLGFFALIVMASWFQDTFHLESRLNAIVSGVALSIAVIPVIFTLAEEAIRAVPRSYVEASTALGAARWQTVLRVVLPAASPGIAAGVALGLGRAVGETMIVLMASGNAAIVSASLADSTRTVSATIAAELAEVVFGGAHYTVLFFLGTLLFIATFGINTAGDWAIRRMKTKLGATS